MLFSLCKCMLDCFQSFLQLLLIEKIPRLVVVRA